MLSATGVFGNKNMDEDIGQRTLILGRQEEPVTRQLVYNLVVAAVSNDILFSLKSLRMQSLNILLHTPACQMMYTLTSSI